MPSVKTAISIEDVFVSAGSVLLPVKTKQNQDEHSKTVRQHDFPQMELSCLFGGPKIHVFTTFGVLSLASIKNKSTSEHGKFLFFFRVHKRVLVFSIHLKFLIHVPLGGLWLRRILLGLSFPSLFLVLSLPSCSSSSRGRAGWVPHKVRA